MKFFVSFLVLAIIVNEAFGMEINRKKRQAQEDDGNLDDRYGSQGGFGAFPIRPIGQRPGQGFPGQGFPGQGFPGQGFPGQGFPGQGFQGFPGQVSQGQGFPGQGSQGQGFPGQGSQGQGFPGQGSQGQGFPGQGSQGQGFPGQGSQGQGFPGQGQSGQGQGFPGQNQFPSQFPGQGQSGQGQSNQGQNGQGQAPSTNLPAGPTTQSPEIDACIRSCPVTPEYNPVCGSDSVTYSNPGRLNCAQLCGINVSLARSSPCPAATTSAPAPVLQTQ